MTFLLTFGLLSLAYRGLLYWSICHGSAPILGYTRENFSLLLSLQCLVSDLWVGLFLAAALLFVRWATRRPRRTTNTGRPSEVIVYGALLLFVMAAMLAELYLVSEEFSVTKFFAIIGPASAFYALSLRSGAGQTRAVTRHFFGAFLIVALFFGVVMGISLCHRQALDSSWLPYWIWKSFRYLLVGGGVWLTWLLLTRASERLGLARVRERWPNARACAGISLSLLIYAFVLVMHYRLLLELRTGLTLAVVRHGWARMAAHDVVGFIRPGDFLCLAAPPALFVALYALHHRFGRIHWQVASGFVAGGLALWLFSSGQTVRSEIALNPLQFFVRDARLELLSSEQAARNFAHRQDLPGAEQMRSVQLIDPAFISDQPVAPAALPPAASQKAWNVVFFIMESTGAEYVFDTAAGNSLPMPFFKELSEKSLNLRNHYSAANASGGAVFSLLTGIYPCPGNWMATDPDNFIPTVSRVLGSRYHSFFIHPVNLTFVFPAPLLLNSGMRDIYDRKAIAVHEHPDRDALAGNEIDSISFLLEKIDSARQPFFGVYFSFVPHFPYSDYGKKYHLFPDQNDERHRYYNNLRLLDTQIQRLYAHLAARGLLDNTILVFVGDHSEAFGQHLGIWKHGIGMYNETLRTPAIFYQPALFPPRSVQRATSHVDLLPTLLDAMGKPYNPKLFQGESLFRESHRKYIFSSSKFDDSVTAIDTGGVKLSASFKNNTCYAYDLARNPRETLRLSVVNYPEQMDALLKFHNYQQRTFAEYNRSAQEGRDFHGERLRY